MEKEMKITAPDGCEIEKVELVDGVAVVTFREKLPKSWEEFCEIGSSIGTYVLDGHGDICSGERPSGKLYPQIDKTMLPDRATAEAVRSLCQLIQLRNCYNGDWVPDWKDYRQDKHAIVFCEGKIFSDTVAKDSTMLYFKSADLRDEFLHCFRPLIEKLKPLYGMKGGGEEC